MISFPIVERVGWKVDFDLNLPNPDGKQTNREVAIGSVAWSSLQIELRAAIGLAKRQAKAALT